MIVVDSHLDLAWNALNWNRDLTLPLEEIRRAEAGMDEYHRGANTVCFPEMRRGDVAICLATVLSRCTPAKEPLLDWRSQEIASAMGHGQRTYYRILEKQGHMRMLQSADDIHSHLDAWRKGSRQAIGYILSMEGAEPILSPDDAADWWEKGLRAVGLTHYGPGLYGDGTSASDGLTPKGFELLKAFEQLGMVVDMTHLTDKGFWQVMETYQGKVIASHNNCRSLVPGERQFSDEQIKALIDRGAVIGGVLDSWMLWPGYVRGETDNSQIKLRMVTDHMDHICQLAGNARHIAIGSDLDGGFGKEQSPSDLETIADLQQIPVFLREKGYAQMDIEGVMHGNWVRFFTEAWSGTEK
jgi:membrane dipeptidase